MDENLDIGREAKEQPQLLLSKEEIAALGRPDKGITPVPQRQYMNLEEFWRDQNNFHATFTNPTFGGDPLRMRKAYQRFQILYPDLDKPLRAKFAELREDGPPTLSDEDRAEIFEAYKLMSELVDIYDPYLPVDPKVQKVYLTL